MLRNDVNIQKNNQIFIFDNENNFLACSILQAEYVGLSRSLQWPGSLIF